MAIHYKDKCPLCGSYINIKYATVCPGCRSPLYFGPSLYGEGDCYYANKAEYEDALEAARERSAAENRTAFLIGSGVAIAGMLIWSWTGFRTSFVGCFGIVLLLVGVLMAWATSK